MMDIRPIIASPDPLISSRDLRSVHSVFAPREHSTMIIDDNNHNSSMPVSPKQGETITPDSLIKQEPQLVSSSLTSNSWEHLSSQPISSFSSATTTHLSSTVLSQSWASTPQRVSPPLQVKTVRDALEAADKFQAKQMNAESRFDSWAVGQGPINSTTTSSSPASSPHNQPSPSRRRDLEENEEHPSTTMSTSQMSVRNCDRPDSSPSPQSQLNSSFDESEHNGNEASMQNNDSFVASSINIYGSFERRSRRKPTIGDIIRRVRPPVDAPIYDSEESEIEDDILQEEMMEAKRIREHQNDEVDGMTKANMRISSEADFREDSRQFTVAHLSRLEAVDGAPEDEDDEEMEMRSENDSIEEADKHAFLKDVPESIYNLMHEVKVNAHAMFMKTVNSLPPSEAKLRREQYLLQLLSNLRDRCLDEGLKADVIGAILKDVENEVTYLSEELEDMKMKQFFLNSDKDSSNNGIDGNESHFLSRPDIKLQEDKEKRDFSGHETSYSTPHQPSFFTTTSEASPLPASSSSSSSPSSDTKPIIVTVSADMKLQPPLPTARGGLPPNHPLASSISEHAFSPMFPNGKLNSWFPPGLVNSMAMYNFNTPGPLDHVLVRKFMNMEGKIGDSVDKDYLKCQFCERTFRRQKNLENHIENTHQGKGTLKPRRDTNDMYFKCSHCPYTTKHQSNLYVHLRIHTGERPYICGACGVQYSQSHSLKSHIINKHDGIMSLYIKEKRTRSPRGMGYLSAQVMHDSNIFKLPSPIMGSPMHQNNFDIVNKAIEYATSENAKHQQQLRQQQQHFSSPAADGSSPRGMMLPPLTPIISNDNNNITSSSCITQSSSAKSPATPGSGHNTPTPNNTLFNTPGAGHHHHPFFMNSHPLMFGELPSHLRNPNHLGSGHHTPTPHPFLSGFPHFPPNSSVGYHGAAGLSPLPGLSPNSSPASTTPNSHHTLPPHHLPVSLSHLTSSPIPLLQQQQIKKEPQAISSTPVSSKQIARSQLDEAIDLRKKSPPLETREKHAHDLNICGGKENCAHAAKLKYLRQNVVKMLGILVPNLNFAEKGISAESESVDELLQDVIESNTHDDDME